MRLVTTLREEIAPSAGLVGIEDDSGGAGVRRVTSLPRSGWSVELSTSLTERVGIDVLPAVELDRPKRPTDMNRNVSFIPTMSAPACA